MELLNEVMSARPDTEIVTTRIINEKRERVFEAWSDPAMLSRWWGPNGFTNTFEQFEFYKGGTWKFVMRGPEGGEYLNQCRFIEITENKFICWNHQSNPTFQVLTSFDDFDLDSTKITFKMVFLNADDCAKLKPFVIGKNEENMDRLTSVLKS